MKCTVCGASMNPINTDLPFKLSEALCQRSAQTLQNSDCGFRIFRIFTLRTYRFALSC